MEEINSQLEEKFHLKMTLKGVFIDSFSQQPWNKGDQHQQEVFQQETQKLWDFAKDKKLSAFKTVEDVLKEDQQLKDENQKLDNLITDDIADIKKQLKEQGASLDAVKVKNNAQDAILANLDAFPLGTILPWVNRPSTRASHYEKIPDGWVVCDGRVILNGVWKGSQTPNLNGEGRFLRGGSLADALTMESHMVQDHVHADQGHTHADAGHTHTDAGHEHMYEQYSWAKNTCPAGFYTGGSGGYEEHYDPNRSTVSRANIQASKANIQT